MSKEKWRVPKLRFPGFTEDWEQRKFSDITYLSGIKNKENKPYESYSISNEFGFIPQDEQFENGGTMKTADKSMYYIVSQNSFAYNPARINVGSIGYYDKPNNVIVSSLYEVFKTIDIVNDKFLWHWFKSNQFNRLIEKYQEGGVRLYFYYDKLCKGTIDLPTINEQNKISNLLDRLDLYITLHQRKLNNLKLKKKALLQKLFPKNGERYPELRFPGFTDAWEQRKLSDILKVNSGKDYKHLEQGDIPVYGTGGYMLSVNESLSNIDAIGIGRKGTIDKPQYLKAPFWTVDTLFYLTALDKHSILFLYYLMQLMPWKKFDESTGVPSLSKTTIDNINGYVPSNPKEEELISALFNQLDKSITLHQRKLDHLQLQKKALLQQMFV
ncbi:MAG: restriction endonuclease subunit S [Veillonella parvula]|uniref:restriction endonuclease subunit S n=1 Tax=Veillonella parvula TaxID=29466 RepID=UPI0039934812